MIAAIVRRNRRSRIRNWTIGVAALASTLGWLGMQIDPPRSESNVEVSLGGTGQSVDDALPRIANPETTTSATSSDVTSAQESASTTETQTTSTTSSVGTAPDSTPPPAGELGGQEPAPIDECADEPGSATDLTLEPSWNVEGDVRLYDSRGCMLRSDVAIVDANSCDSAEVRILQIDAEHGKTWFLSPGMQIFVRDPDGFFATSVFAAPYLADAKIPSDAKPSGYFIDGRELFRSPDEDSVFVPSGGSYESWPLVIGEVGCD